MSVWICVRVYYMGAHIFIRFQTVTIFLFFSQHIKSSQDSLIIIQYMEYFEKNFTNDFYEKNPFKHF